MLTGAGAAGGGTGVGVAAGVGAGVAAGCGRGAGASELPRCVATASVMLVLVTLYCTLVAPWK